MLNSSRLRTNHEQSIIVWQVGGNSGKTNTPCGGTATVNALTEKRRQSFVSWPARRSSLDWANGGNDDVCDLAFDYCAPVANYTVQEKGHTTRERANSTAAAIESMDNSIFFVCWIFRVADCNKRNGGSWKTLYSGACPSFLPLSLARLRTVALGRLPLAAGVHMPAEYFLNKAK